MFDNITTSVGVNTSQGQNFTTITQVMEAACLPKSARRLYLALLQDCEYGSLISTLKYKKMSTRAQIRSDSTKAMCLAVLQLLGFIRKERRGKYRVHRLKKIRQYPWLQELGEMSKQDRQREIEEILSLPNTPLKYNTLLITKKLREETACAHAHEKPKLSISLKFKICFLYVRIFYRYQGEAKKDWEKHYHYNDPKRIAETDMIFVAMGIMRNCDGPDGWQRIVKKLSNRVKIIRKAIAYSRGQRLKIGRKNAEAKRNQDNNSMQKKFIDNMTKINYSSIRTKAVLQIRSIMGSRFREDKMERFIKDAMYYLAKTGSYM